MSELRRLSRDAQRAIRAERRQLDQEVERAGRFLDEISAMLDPEDGKAPSQTQGGPA